MSQWIKKTPVLPLHGVPIQAEDDADGHRCQPPPDVDAGPRSIWECDCGRRWRIAMPFWRPLAGVDSTRTPADLPPWVLDLQRPRGSQL